MSLNGLMDRANDANAGAKKLDSDTATLVLGASATTTTSIVDVIKKANRKKRKRINVSLDEDIFDKIITLSNGKSASAVMEKILIDAVKDVKVDRDIVNHYKETMENKGRKPKDTNSEASSEDKSQ